MIPSTRTDQADALREFLRQNEMAGTGRRALLLHMDRLPPALARPHHLRLAREALNSLVMADRAQSFELSRGRIAIVWRDRGGDELARTVKALDHLLAGQTRDEAPVLGELITLYDLPSQAIWLMDELCDDAALHPPSSGRPLDLPTLATLETTLARADLSPFARRRPVMRLRAAGPPAAALARIETTMVWEERYFASYALEASLAPDHALKADPWLFGRLTRALDRRMLAMLGAPGELRANRTLAITLNVATILSADFLRFDDLIPAHLRGEAILNIRPADMLATPRDFLFARGFARARGYRLALTGASLPLLQVLDLEAAGFDYIQVKLGPDISGAPEKLTSLAAPGTELIAMGLDRASDVRWALSAGITLGMGRALSH
jgi:hypothetical protein